MIEPTVIKCSSKASTGVLDLRPLQEILTVKQIAVMFIANVKKVTAVCVSILVVLGIRTVRLVRCETGIVVGLARHNSDLTMIHIACSVTWCQAASHPACDNAAIQTTRAGHAAVHYRSSL